MMIELDKVEYHPHSRDGTWCTLPYPGHPKGCPNYPDCINSRKDFREYPDDMKWTAVVVTFDLLHHAEMMKEKHPDWSERQCRNVLYWQNSVRAHLRHMVREISNSNDIILEIPEAHGVNVFLTMRNHGILLKPRPDIVRKIMLVGRSRKIEEFKGEGDPNGIRRGM